MASRNSVMCRAFTGVTPAVIGSKSFENLAVTVLLTFMVTVQEAASESQPLHPVSVEPGSDTAVRFTDAPLLKVSEQSAPQLIPVPVTVPSPDPALETVRVKVGRLTVKLWLAGWGQILVSSLVTCLDVEGVAAMRKTRVSLARCATKS